MKPINKKDVNPKVFDLYNDYAHSRIDRRQFMEGLSLYAIGGLTVPSLLDYLMPKYQTTLQVAVDDPRLKTDMISYESPNGGGTIKAQLSRPKDAKDLLPGIVIVHENRGLNPHIADVGRRAALAGFITIAPDMLTPLGGYPGTDDEGRTMQRQRDRNEMLEDFKAAFRHLHKSEECNGKIGVVGFCFGGWISNMMAAQVSELSAAVPFYGSQAPLEEVPNINAPILLQFAENDKRVNAGKEAYEAELTKHGKVFESHLYPGTNHGFHNDSTPRYDEAAAKLAWQRTIDFFDKYLK